MLLMEEGLLVGWDVEPQNLLFHAHIMQHNRSNESKLIG